MGQSCTHLVGGAGVDQALAIGWHKGECAVFSLKTLHNIFAFKFVAASLCDCYPGAQAMTQQHSNNWHPYM